MSDRRDKKRANLRDVAREANVSVATVSRVLNAPEKVRAETRDRVESKIVELNFVPSAAARAVNSGRSKILGALIPTLDSDIFAKTIDAMERRLTDFGLSLIVATTEDDREIEMRKVRELLDIGVEGLFLSGVTHERALQDLVTARAIPTVAISFFDESYHIPTIGYDNQEAARSACGYLVALGHRDIVVVHGPAANNDRTRARLGGVMEFDDQIALRFEETDLSVIGGSDAAIGISRSGAVPDAVLCLSDVLAYGVLFAFDRAGIKVPADVSVMGIHDLPGSSVVVPRLSTVHLPTQEMGAKAAEALAGWVENSQRPDAISLPTRLVIRDSTRTR